MLVYSKERFYPTTINTLVLEDSEGAFWYVHRTVYDNALTLAVKQTVEGVATLIDSSNNEEAVLLWNSLAPYPLNILAPYLGLVTAELPLDIQVLAGVMHVITSQIDVYNLIRQKKEHRQTVKFSLSIINEYEMSWDSFKSQCTKPVFDTPVFSGQPYSNSQEAHYIVNEAAEDSSSEGTKSISLEGLEEGVGIELTAEDLKNDPNWRDLGFGTWYNEKLGQSLCLEDDDTDYEAEFAERLEQQRAEDKALTHEPEKIEDKTVGSSQSRLSQKLRLGARG